MSTDGGIDCDCRYCKDVKLDSITKDYWNTLRRQHALYTWNKLMKNLNDMIQGNNVENASEEVLEKSRLKIFKELLPSY
jgi:wyosine [tRNA(Phe)-imidazoG37] synthetase (radical SAM superfamily)